MAENLARKILAAHLVSGRMEAGAEIAIRIDQTLTQDATGTMAYLQFEAMGIPRVRTKLSVSYVDHNMLQSGFENADDHRFLQSVAARFGLWFSRPGNGICHQVHLERFGVPGDTLLGSDSHTPTGGGLGMISIGAGGLDVACAMAGEPFHLAMPRIVGVRLTGRLAPWVAAKDVILELLRRRTVKGGVGKIFEYFGPGVAALSVYQRATITNMGAELGATCSLFPSDEVTQAFLARQQRAPAWRPLAADDGATYDETEEIDLGGLEPMVARPHSPDSVVPVREVAGLPVDQVCVGSCTNSSVADLMTCAEALRGRTVHPRVSMTISPGSRQVLEVIARSGALAELVRAGVRIIEAGCGPCIGMGVSPPSGGVSVRSFNRNFEGRSGTADGKIYLASPEVCVAAAVTGALADPRTLGVAPRIEEPAALSIDDGMLVPPLPPAEAAKVEVLRGPNIAPVPRGEPSPDPLPVKVVLRTGDNITTDHIMPAGAKVLPLRSNIPRISEHVFVAVDPTFPARAKAAGPSVVVGGSNYGQGSSREHAALAPMYLGVRAVLAKSFARIHKANLINFGIMPLTFADAADYDRVEPGDDLELGAPTAEGTVRVRNRTRGMEFDARHDFTARQLDILRRGGLLNWVRERALAQGSR